MRLVLLAVVFGVLVGARRVRERRVYDLKGRLHRSGPRIVCSLAAMLPVILVGCAATSSRAAMADRPRAIAVALPGIPRDTTSAVATVAMATTNQSVHFYGYDASSMATTALQFVATNTPGASRLPQDVNVNPNSPGALPTSGRSIGRASHNTAVANDLAAARAAGATDIRLNQQQVNAAGQRVGVNRPDLQYTLPNGQRVYIEYEGVGNPRGAAHTTRITANDPSAQVIVKIVP